MDQTNRRGLCRSPDGLSVLPTHGHWVISAHVWSTPYESEVK